MKKVMKRMLVERDERGYTLLEYCAGAAIIAGVVWIAMEGLGGQLAALLERIGLWAADRANGIQISS